MNYWMIFFVIAMLYVIMLLWRISHLLTKQTGYENTVVDAFKHVWNLGPKLTSKK